VLTKRRESCSSSSASDGDPGWCETKGWLVSASVMVTFCGLSLSTAMTLYVVPIVYVLMDRLCLALTGRSSASGLKRAEEIREQTAQDGRGRLAEPAMVK